MKQTTLQGMIQSQQTANFETELKWNMRIIKQGIKPQNHKIKKSKLLTVSKGTDLVSESPPKVMLPREMGAATTGA